MEDDPTRARLVADVLAAESESELTELVHRYGPERVADAFVDAILHFSDLHPSELTKAMCAAVQKGAPSPPAIERGVAAVGDTGLREEARAAMLCALSAVPGMQSRLVLAGIPVGDIRRLVDLAKRWDRRWPSDDPDETGPMSSQSVDVDLMSEFEVLREVQARRASYDRLVEHVFGGHDAEEILRRLGEYDSFHACGALVDKLLSCPLEDRELVRNIATHSFSDPAGIFHKQRPGARFVRTRLAKTAADPATDWDLRWHCFLLYSLFSATSHYTTRLTPPFDAVDDDDWGELLRGYHRATVILFGGGPAICSAAAAVLEADEIESLLRRLVDDGVTIDWVGMFTYKALAAIWPFVAETLADAGTVQAMDRIEARIGAVDDVADQARMRRAVMRLRNR